MTTPANVGKSFATFGAGRSLEPQVTNALRQELAEYSEDELYTISAVYVWRKP